jgi:hypothetical protein
MTSPSGEHISRYRALGEFDNLIREANKAKRALRELREEEAKLNAQSLADDKKVTASKADRARAVQSSTEAAKKALSDLARNQSVAGRSGEDTGVAYSRGIGRGIERDTRTGGNRQFLNDATKALQQAFANAGAKSGEDFAANTRNRIIDGVRSTHRDSRFQQAFRELGNAVGSAGMDTGNRYVQGFASKIRDLNIILGDLGMDKLDLDVDTEDARQSIKAVEFELNALGHRTANPQVRIDTNRALANLRAIQKLFRDEVAEDMVKESIRIRKELEKIDNLPSGRSFKFWALTALSDMARVFDEADRGTNVFTRLRRAMMEAGGGGGGNFFRSFISGFDNFSEASSRLLQRLGRVSGELYRMPGIIAVLVSSLPALIAGLGALVGGAGALASGLGALSGFLAAGPGLFLALGTAVASTATVFSGFGEALKAAEKAQEAEAEAKEQARLGTEKALTPAQKYTALLKEMAPATREVTKEFVKFSDEFTDLKDVVAERFFKEVVDDTDALNKTLPILEDLLGKAAEAVGKLASRGINMVTSGPWKRDFATLAKENATNITNMGEAGFSLANAFRNIAVAAIPFTRWITGALREGAKSFADWSAAARANGSINAFLMETRESGESLWQIFKNLGRVVKSFFQTSVDEGQRYMTILQSITARWAMVAKAQEAANSPLRKWMTDIRPVLTSLGELIKALAVGIAGLASDQRNISAMIDLLDALRTEVLPPILTILQQLNDSGLAVTVIEAFGGFLSAISDFLNSGAVAGLEVFVKVLAGFAELIFSFAGLPVVSEILGGLAMALGAVAAVSIVARFTGLFKLWDFFTWMTRNRGNLSGAFADAARGVAGLNTTGQAVPTRIVPSPVAIGGVGSEVLANQAKATEAVGRASATASTQTGLFARALNNVRSAGNTARGALSSLSGFVGGPWGVALIAATTLIGIVTNKLMDNKRQAQDTRQAFLALRSAYDELASGDSSGVQELAQTDEKFKDIIESARSYGLTLRDVSGALNNNQQDLTRFNSAMDAQIAQLVAARDEQVAYARSQGDTTGAFQQGIDAVNGQIEAAQNYRKEVNRVAETNRNVAAATGLAANMSRTYQERLAGLSQSQVDSAVSAGGMLDKMQSLSSALDTMSSASATAEERARAMGDIIRYQAGETERGIEASELWSSSLLGLTEAVDANGRSLSRKTREGLRNRDALQAAAKATRELYLEDIASGIPMDKATQKHQERIKELEKEAKRLNLNEDETRKLIDAYGDVPEDVNTDIHTDKRGFEQVFADLMKLQVMQRALQEGKSVNEAQREWVNESSKLYQRPPSTGDGYGAPGYATGGPVWGAGTKTSDSIRAWLSNGEFVQPADAVEYYGMPAMEALRTRKLDKAALNEALPDGQTTNFKSGGPAHSSNCPACASGGHKFARGGSVDWPFEVDPRNTKINQDWATNIGGLGTASGSGGVAWMMSVLRKQFPGLPLISGYRPGSRTLSGNRSYHSLNRAVDLPPRRDVAQWIRSNYGARTKELITPYNDLNLHNGKPHRYTGAIWNQHNFAGGNAHDHWAYRQGGLVDLMKMLNMDNLAPQQEVPSIPTTPRSLSPAASSVINNTTESGMNFGDVIINNPQQERAGDSVRNALFRTRYLV